MAAGGGGGAAAYMGMREAHRRILEYLNRFSDSVLNKDGRSLSRLFSISFDSPHLLSLADALNTGPFQDASRLIRQSDECSQYTEIIQSVFCALQSYRLRNLVESYQAFEKAADLFIQEFRNWESAWALEALYVVAYEIRVLAERVRVMCMLILMFPYAHVVPHCKLC